MDWLFLVISSGCFVGVFLHLNILHRALELTKIPQNVFRIIRSSGVSDHWKEKALPRYSLRLLSQSLTIFVLLLISFSPFVFFALFSTLMDGQFISLVSSLKGIAVSSLTAILFAKILSGKSTCDYGVSARLLHQFVLGSSFFGETLFDIEKAIHGSKARDVSNGKHVFVAGLARAGTTILMRTLYENGNFCSLTYRDMPFILAPNTWRTFSNLSTRNVEKRERAHGDGIKVDYDSPEALEEVFWRAFSGSDYIKKDYLTPMVADGTVVENFRSFVSIILKIAPDKCYLSKNNNNILRLDSIIKAFPESLIVVPFREPLQQAFSLRNQHNKFVNEEDPFTKKYMTWLVHHEFGADHRPFLFNEQIGTEEGTEKLSYWLQLWINTYSYLLEKLPAQAMFLSYELLCDDTEHVWQELSEKIDLTPHNESITFSKSISLKEDDIPQDLLSHATEIYEKLTNRSIGFR
ncbi:MAG: hypothetical protein ACI8ZB_003694 [Desulforhopalus sp.]|jgi:hypothetical protein